MKRNSRFPLSVDKRADRMAYGFTLLLVSIAIAVLSVSESHALLVEGGSQSGVNAKTVEVDVMYTKREPEESDSPDSVNTSTSDNMAETVPVKEENTNSVVRKKTEHNKPAPKKIEKKITETKNKKKHLKQNRRSDTANTLNPPSSTSKTSVNSESQNNSENSSSTTDSKENYNLLLSKLSSLKRYPQRARRQGKEGECIILLKLSENGTVLSGEINKSSNHLVLDSECNRLISKIVGFNTEIRNLKKSVLIPISFHLKDD